jgi:hypothetical protein
MYSVNSKGIWKHLDFLLWGIVGQELAFLFAYLIKFHSFNALTDKYLYINIAVFIAIIGYVCIMV